LLSAIWFYGFTSTPSWTGTNIFTNWGTTLNGVVGSFGEGAVSHSDALGYAQGKGLPSQGWSAYTPS
jgi:hypothetical protein